MIMVTVFAAFALADVLTIKAIGVGMAIAVLVDATSGDRRSGPAGGDRRRTSGS